MAYFDKKISFADEGYLIDRILGECDYAKMIVPSKDTHILSNLIKLKKQLRKTNQNCYWE